MPVIVSRPAARLPVARLPAARLLRLPLRGPVLGSQPAKPVTQRLHAFLFEKEERRLSEVCARYPKLAVSMDFSTLLHSWAGKKDLDVPLNVNIPFRTDPDLILKAPAEPAETPDKPKVMVRVMLLSTMKPDEAEKVKPHLTKRIKFLVAKRANGGLMSIGGAWSASKDGSNPNDEKTLIKTAIRTCKEICGIDLTPCKKWHKFVEVKYNRATGVEDRTVVFLPDVWNHFASKDKVDIYRQVAPQEVEEEEEQEVEEEPKEGETEKKMVKKKVKVKKMVDKITIRSMEMSLYGLLEYDPQDKHEETVELSLFAEAFREMLSVKFALQVVDILQVKKQKLDAQVADLKRKREEDTAKAAADREEREAKRRKLEEDKKKEAELKAKKAEEEKLMTEEEIKERRAEEAEAKKKKEEEEKKAREEELKAKKEAEEARKKQLEEEKKRKEEEAKNKTTKTKVSTTVHVDEETLAPFSFFDIPKGEGVQSGQLKRDQLEAVLFGLGSLCPRDVDGLLRAAGLPKEKAHLPLMYKALATTTTTSIEEVPIEGAKKEGMQVDEEPK